jgi:hypothetical protein
VNGSVTLNGKGTASVGTVVNKVGRTTGWSQGQVTRTCVNTGVTGSTVYLFCQNWVKATVDHGDSGSPVFDNSNRFLGLDFIYSPVAQIEQELGALSF